MMDTGHMLRMRRVFARDGRSVIVALDHLAAMPRSIPALADVPAVVRAAREGGADAVLVPPAAAREAADDLGDLGVVLSVPWSCQQWRQVPELGLRSGADMVKVMFYPFGDGHDNAVPALAALGAACARWRLPLLVESIPGGFTAGPELRRADALAAGARIAAECGASAIKTFVPQADDTVADLDGLRHLCAYAGVPVVVLGGERTGVAELSRRAGDAVRAGAAGVAVGRNVWGHPQPAVVVAELAAAVRGRR
jgi:DhnA family fructose-bisphosphate aldolase class Ia